MSLIFNIHIGVTRINMLVFVVISQQFRYKFQMVRTMHKLSLSLGVVSFNSKLTNLGGLMEEQVLFTD